MASPYVAQDGITEVHARECATPDRRRRTRLGAIDAAVARHEQTLEEATQDTQDPDRKSTGRLCCRARRNETLEYHLAGNVPGK